MKKSRIIGYALTLAATLVVGSAMGQAIAIPSSYVKSSTETNYVTTGTKTKLFVEQIDLAYGGAAGLKWNWTIDVAAGWSITGASTSTNYVEATWGTVGVYTIGVQMDVSGVTGFTGACAADIQSATVNVLPKPTLNITSADEDFCSTATDATKTVAITASEGSLPATLMSYKYQYKVDILTLNAGTGAFASKTVGTATDATGTGASLTITTPTISVVDNKVTKYVLTLIDNSLSSAITRKADVTVDATTTSFTGFPIGGTKQFITYIIKPAPKTGPIYHIANNTSL